MNEDQFIKIGDTVKYGDLQAEYEWVYDVRGPNGRTLYRRQFEEDAIGEAHRTNLELRRLGAGGETTVHRRKRLMKLWIGDWEQVVLDEV